MAESCQTIDLLSDEDDCLSTELLYKFFCNNLSLGQWELTRATINNVETCNNKEFISKLHEVLQTTLEEPLVFCKWSSTIPSPFHLSWLCLLEMTKHKITVPAIVQKRVEFRLLLYFSHCHGMPSQCITDLDYHHLKITKSKVLGTIPNLSLIQPLNILLKTDTRIAIAIIQQLIGNGHEFAENNAFFLNIYLDLIEEYLKKLTTLDTELRSIENKIQSRKEYGDFIYQLLVALDIDTDNVDHRIDEVLTKLYQKVEHYPLDNLSKGSIYSAFLAHRTTKLFERFSQIENKLRLSLNGDQLLAINSPLHNMVKWSTQNSRPDVWKMFYFYAKDGHHILQDIVQYCVSLFSEHADLSAVSEILSYEEFSPLKILVLLLSWPLCRTCDAAHKLLNALWNPFHSTKHLLLNQACTKLEYQVNLVTWCLDKAKPLIATDDCNTVGLSRTCEMFQSLDSYSILRVLHQSTNLSKLPVDEVLEMLRTTPVFAKETSDDDFDEEAEISRNIALFHGFCAIRYFMELFVTSVSDDVQTKMNEVVQTHISQIFPLTFRIEVLENIFSLLFISSEHFTELENGDSDDLETLESRSLRSSRTTSMESFVSIDSKNTSPWRSRTVSPDPNNQNNGISPTRFPEEQTEHQQSMVVEETASPSTTHVSRELQYGHDDDDDVTNYQFRLPLEDKEQLLKLKEKKGRGFLVHSNLIGPFLQAMKQCLKDISDLKDDHEKQHKIYCGWMKTSVTKTTFEQRASRFAQYVNEAQWRYQLISTCGNNNDSNGRMQDEDDGDTIGGTIGGGGRISDHDDDDSDTDEQVDITSRMVRKSKKRMFQEPRVMEEKVTSGEKEVTSISRLLSSPHSLIYMCMKQDNFGQAKHIIKLFNIEYSQSAKAVLFAEEYEKSYQKIVQVERNKNRAERTQVKKTGQRSSLLRNVASTAAASIAAVSSASIVEELLLSFNIDLAASGLLLTQPAHVHFIHALVAFDMVCAGITTISACKAMLEIAKQNMDLAIDIEPSTAYTLRRISDFINMLLALVATESPLLQDTLFCHIRPLNGKTMVMEQDLLSKQDSLFEVLEEAIDDGDDLIKSLAEGSVLEMPAVVKYKKMQQKTAVRMAMSQFQKLFSCDKYNILLSSHGKSSVSNMVDYVQSLCHHVDTLSTWELYWKMRPKERNAVQLGSQKPITLKATNPFVVLTQGFDDLAGRPLFERNVSPRSMESMCRKMNVNLMRIIVHNCCPVIPAIGGVQNNDIPENGKIVLNFSNNKLEVKDPCSLAEKLVTETINLKKGERRPGFPAISSKTPYSAFQDEIRKLCWVDLNELKTDEDKICFFTNVLNTLLQQALITEVNNVRGDYSREDGSVVFDCTHSPNLGISYTRTSYLKKYGYNIGQMGFMSAYDLWYIILKQRPPSNMKVVPLCSQLSRRYVRYQTNKSDSRLIFTISDGSYSAPEIQVLRRSGLEEQLNEIKTKYLSDHVTINLEEEKIFLPELLQWYHDDVISGDIDCDLMSLIVPYLHGDQFEDLAETLAQLSVTFIPHCWRIGDRSPVSSHQRTTTAKPTGAKYSLTPSLSNYLTTRSPLVSSLANLSCAQDSKSKNNDPPSLVSSFHSNSAHSLAMVSPFEYALNQTDWFPILQRHITSSYYPLLKFFYLDGMGLVHQTSTQTTDSDNFRLFLLDECTPGVSDIFRQAVNYAWCKGDWQLLLDICNLSNIKESNDLAKPGDFALQTIFQSSAVIKDDNYDDDDIMTQATMTLKNFNIPQPNFELNWKKHYWLLLYRIQDNFIRACLLLQCLHNWNDVNVCLKLLYYCCSKPPQDQELLENLKKKTRQVHLCAKILRCHKSRSFVDSKMGYETWKDVIDQSIRNPEKVVRTLLDHEQFELVQEWMHVFKHVSNYNQEVHEVYLYYLFKKIPLDTTDIYLYLEEINDLSEALLICESLLLKQLTIPNVVFLLHFMNTNLASVISPVRKRDLLRQKLGAKALLCIPETSRRRYEPLLCQPLLILEQLLMDMKVEWAAKMFQELKNEVDRNDDYEENLKKEICVEEFEKLLVSYATKALEFEVVTCKETDTTKSQSSVFSTSTPKKKSHKRHASIGATVQSSSRSSGSDPSEEHFRIPDNVPAEENWEPDYKHTICMICKDVTFNMFVRRHHCRRCGRVVCDGCSPFKHILSTYGRTPVRVCKECDKMIYEQRVHSKDATDQSASLPTYLSKSGTKKTSENHGSGSDVINSEDDLNFTKSHDSWRLTLNIKSNEIIREEFLYEQAPSSALCTSILALHSNSKNSGELLLQLCNKLSKKLGISDEVDNNLIISIICQLLLHAKIKFISCEETHGVELCDTYTSRVELVKFLIESNFYDVLSIEDLMSSQNARRLRDQLIESESLALAMEVTTKCSLDAAAVWGAWGLAYLKVGEFKNARQKFGKFLKPSERGKVTQSNVLYLQKIICILETSCMISFDNFLMSNLDTSLANLRDHAKSFNGTTNIDGKRFEECIFYLNTYGSYSDIVSFYVKHNQLKFACRYILEKRCSPEIFTESLLLPVLNNGQFEQLRDLLKMFDPSLEVWTTYLNGTCKYLSKIGYLHVLYQVQLLIKDYFRAAMTCIMFYKGLPRHVATSYQTLHCRLKYLQDAKGHLEAVRKHQQSKKGTLAMVTSALQMNMGENSDERSRMSVSPSDLTNHINAITLQIDVTNFMHNCYIEGTISRTRKGGEKLGTLFDNATAKCEVVSEILLAGSSVNDGFSLSCRIIQDFRLPACEIYKTVAENLARQQKMSEIQLLLNNASQTRLISEKEYDSVIMKVLTMFAPDEKKWKQTETMIKLLKDDAKKVSAYMKLGRLRAAYLIAVAGDRVGDVQAIANIARESEQSKIYDICMKWLANKNPQDEPSCLK